METRTLYALVAAALLVPLGTAVAQDASEPTTAKPTQTYKIGFMPAEQWAPSGATVAYRIVAESRSNQTLSVSVHAPDILGVTLSSEEIVVSPGAPGAIALTVVSRENTSAAKLPIVVVAKSATGETHEARATLVLREKPTEKPNATARPHEMKPYPAEPKPYAADRPQERPHERPHEAAQPQRVDDLEKRLELLILRAERYLAKLETMDQARPAKPMPIDRPEPAPIADATLRLSDANVTLGPEGRKVALLVENGDHEGRLPLELRYDAASGWKIELEKDMVKLRPHERTYVWVIFHPGAPGSVQYSVSTGNATMAVQGSATFPGPSTA